MEDKRFDDIIKSKLSEFKIDATPNWELFQEKRFDDIVSSKLADHSMAVTPDWELFQEKRFDNMVSSKLENHSMASTPRWDLFQEKQQQIQAKHKDTAFDNKVRQNIGKYTVPYNSDHWIQLKDRLEKVYSRRQGLYTLKSLEIIVLLILLINFAGNFNNLIGTTPEIHNSISTLIVDSQLEENKDKENNATLLAEHVSETTERGDQLNEDSQTHKEITSTQNDVSVNDGGNNNIVVDKSHFNNDIPVVVSDLIANEGNTENQYTSNSGTLPSSTAVADKATPIQKASVINSNNANGLTLSSLLSISNKEIGLLDWSVQQPTLSLNNKLAFSLNDDIEKSVVNTNSGWIHATISFDNNNTITPFNADFPSGRTFGSSQKESVGFSTSLLYSRTFNKLEIETGLAYSRYSRDAEIFDIYFDGPFVYKHKLNSIKYELVSAPVRAKYHFLQRTDFSIFGSVGVSPEVIVASEYSSKKTHADLLPTQGTLPDAELSTSNLEMQANFTNGILHESAFGDSFFLRGSVGMGIQKNISSNVSAYISGDYYFNLINTIGPTNDEISKFSLNFGLKRRI